jgi:hypothetical protein
LHAKRRRDQEEWVKSEIEKNFSHTHTSSSQDEGEYDSESQDDMSESNLDKRSDIEEESSGEEQAQHTHPSKNQLLSSGQFSSKKSKDQSLRKSNTKVSRKSMLDSSMKNSFHKGKTIKASGGKKNDQNLLSLSGKNGKKSQQSSSKQVFNKQSNPVLEVKTEE